MHIYFYIYEGTCSCSKKYVVETGKCVHLRTDEHEDVKKGSGPAKHLNENVVHIFSWKVIGNVPKDISKRNIFLEALYIAQYKPGLNDQLVTRKLRLFTKIILFSAALFTVVVLNLCTVHAFSEHVPKLFVALEVLLL